MRTSLILHSGFLVLIGLATLAAQEKSVNPGINDSFQEPAPQTFVERFEKEGREVYDQRQTIVEKLGLKPGMAVADIGAGTGLFTRLMAPLVGPEGKVYAVLFRKEIEEAGFAFVEELDLFKENYFLRFRKAAVE